jgi:5-(carboxyamino)imidazole ribonucleotide synthase
LACALFLSQRKPVLPDPAVLATTQDRLAEKTFVSSLGIPTARFAAVDRREDLEAALAHVGRPAVLKTRRFGYDGKGQATIRETTDPGEAWEDIGGQPAILEAFVPFEREVSVIAARGADGAMACFDVTENRHRDHILHVSQAPAAVAPSVASEAQRIAETIANAVDYVGVLAVEMFVVADGGGHRVLVNEIAPRVHNSGHWTIDGCTVSQFEQHIRAVAGWPLGSPVRSGRAEMVNLIGDEVADYAKWLEVTGACIHLYGKGEARPGRKMGHVTRIFREPAG